MDNSHFKQTTIANLNHLDTAEHSFIQPEIENEDQDNLLLPIIALIFRREYAKYIHGEEKKNYVQTTSDYIYRSSDYD
jgi:hypothetical protein